MQTSQILDKYLSKEKLSDIICKYQLYYQIGLGSVVLESLQDLKETVDKINQLNLQVRSEVIIDSLSKIIHLHKDNESFDLDFEYYLRSAALSHMLDDFIDADKDFINAEPFRDLIQEKITQDIFFSKTMQQQFEADYNAILPSIKATITEDIAKDVKKIIEEMLNTNNIP
jgi:hypothetical protein